MPGKEFFYYSQFGETSGGGTERRIAAVDSLIEQTRLNVGTISDYCTQWTDLAIYARRTLRETLPENEIDAICTTITNIRHGLDYLAFTRRHDQITEGHKLFVLEDIPAMLNEYQGTDRVVLSYGEARLLQMAAAVVNIAYDPGEPEDTPENVAKRTFIFTDLEQRVLHGVTPEPGKTVDANQ